MSAFRANLGAYFRTSLKVWAVVCSDRRESQKPLRALPPITADRMGLASTASFSCSLEVVKDVLLSKALGFQTGLDLLGQR